MSMRKYAVNDYGMVLDEETMKIIASKVFNSYVDDIEDLENLDYYLYNKGICDYITDFTGEAQIIRDNGYVLFTDDNIYNADSIAYVSLSKYPTLFKKAYDNMEEIIDELKSKIGEYLTEDFDYRSRIRHICGTYYG